MLSPAYRDHTVLAIKHRPYLGLKLYAFRKKISLDYLNINTFNKQTFNDNRYKTNFL